MLKLQAALFLLSCTIFSAAQSATDNNPWGGSASLDKTRWGSSACAASDFAKSEVHGIKIVSSSFDADKHSGQYVFQNVSKHRITAYHALLLEKHADGGISHADISMELFHGEVEALKAKHQIGMGEPITIAPGMVTKKINVGQYSDPLMNVVCVKLTIDMALYDDNTYDGTDHDALRQFQEMRQREAQTERDCARMAGDVLNARVQHPVEALLRNLEAARYGFAANMLRDELESRPVDETKMVEARRDLYLDAAQRYETASKLKEATK